MNPNIQQIQLTDFDLSLSGMRIMNMHRILQIEKSIRVHGQLQAVVARVHEGKYQLIDGFKRYYAAEDLMMETLQCLVLEIDLAQAKVLLLSYNRGGQSMDAWEEAMVLKDLQETHSMDQGSLARLTGYSRSWVSRRLSLISKMDQEVSSDIMMGSLTSSHARALIRLPRGKQGDVARVISSYRLTSRQSESLTEALLKAKDEEQRQYILSHPEQTLKQENDEESDPYDERLSSYGNLLMQGAGSVLGAVQIMLAAMDGEKIGKLNETEKFIITPGFEKVRVYINKLQEAINQFKTHK